MTNWNLRSPCKQCPFRTDIRAYLTQGRAEDICIGIIDEQKHFTCHKTDRDELKVKAEHCAGAAIFLEKLERPNQLMRIAERLGLYDRTKLNMKAPVFDTPEDFINAQPRR